CQAIGARERQEVGIVHATAVTVTSPTAPPFAPEPQPMHKFKPALLATAFAAALALPAAHAADNQDFQVLIDIDASCDVVSTANVDFDTQLAAAGTVDATGGVTVQCTRNQAYNVKLDGGLNSSNDV